MKWQSKIGLGSVQFGLPYGISNQTGQTSNEEVTKILDLAYANGVRILDTASGYGTSESILGMLNNNRFSIISKFGPSSSKEDIRHQLEESLSLLNSNTIYGYLAHRPLDLLDNSIVWNELQKLKAAGIIQKIGFSFNAPEEYYLLKSAGMLPDLVQVPFNYFDGRFTNVLTELKTNGCEIHTRSTFLQGLFFADTEKLSSFFNEVKPMLKFLHETYGKQLEGALLAYVLKQNFIDVVIMGVENTMQLKTNMDSIASAPKLEPLQVTYPEKLLMPMYWPKD